MQTVSGVNTAISVKKTLANTLNPNKVGTICENIGTIRQKVEPVHKK